MACTRTISKVTRILTAVNSFILQFEASRTNEDGVTSVPVTPVWSSTAHAERADERLSSTTNTVSTSDSVSSAAHFRPAARMLHF